MKVSLQGKTAKGKQRIKSYGNIWEVLEIRKSVLFSDKKSDWGLCKPEGFSDDCKESRWIDLISDFDFIVEEL